MCEAKGLIMTMTADPFPREKNGAYLEKTSLC